MRMSQVLDYFADDLAIDLGTANTLIYVRGRGVILDEPSVVAMRSSGGSGKHGRHRNAHEMVLAVGSDAKRIMGKEPGDVRTIRPMKDGVIAELTTTEIMLKHFISKVQTRRFFIRPRIVISVPCQSTEVDRRAIKEAAENAGAREVYLLDEPMAVAIGMDLPVEQPVGTVVVDIGGGTTEIGVISLGGLIYSDTVKVAGDRFDQRIAEYISEKYNMEIGERTAEQIKKVLGTACHDSLEMRMEIRGRDRNRTMCKHVITSSEIFDALSTDIRSILQAVRRAIDNLDPDLVGEICEHGIILAGGGALLRDLDRRFNEELELPAVQAEDPLKCVVRGCGKLIENNNLLANIFR